MKYIPPAVMKAIWKTGQFSSAKTTYIRGCISSRYANQTSLPGDETGLILELRNHTADGKIYLDVQNWETYKYRTEQVKFLSPLNYSDAQLLFIGLSPARSSINFYRNS